MHDIRVPGGHFDTVVSIDHLKLHIENVWTVNSQSQPGHALARSSLEARRQLYLPRQEAGDTLVRSLVARFETIKRQARAARPAGRPSLLLQSTVLTLSQSQPQQPLNCPKAGRQAGPWRWLSLSGSAAAVRSWPTGGRPIRAKHSA